MLVKGMDINTGLPTIVFARQYTSASNSNIIVGNSGPVNPPTPCHEYPGFNPTRVIIEKELGEDIEAYTSVKYKDGVLTKSSIGDMHLSAYTFGITTEAGVIGDKVKVIISGNLEVPAGVITSTGALFYDIFGEITPNPPAMGLSQQIGVAHTLTEIIVRIDPPILF